MSGFKGIAKGGWHPKGKDGGKESWRGDFKGVNTVAGWMGKGKETGFAPNENSLNHQSQPLSSLQDPSSFGPPPKHYAAGGSSGPPVAAPASRQNSSTSSAARGPTRQPTTSEPQWQTPNTQQQEGTQSPPPSVPYRKDTTGLSTQSLPTPPVRGNASQSTAGRAAPAKPAPPPRLPPRQNSHPDLNSPEPPPSYTSAVSESQESASVLNPGAVNRLGRAGVSVPGFGIGSSNSSNSSSTQSSQATSHLGELSNRFGRMSTSSQSAQQQQAPHQGTSWAQKQKAAQTAASFHKDPSSVSFSDARDAASTANNFRQRHGDQVSAGWKKASGLNQKYGVSDKVMGFQNGATNATGQDTGTITTPASAAGNAPVPQPTPQSSNLSSTAVQGKKPPPPPPKKRQLQQPSEPVVEADGPPPVPLASKPR